MSSFYPGSPYANMLNGQEQTPEPSVKQRLMAGVVTLGASEIVRAGGTMERATHPQGLDADESKHMAQDFATWEAANVAPQYRGRVNTMADASAYGATAAPTADQYKRNPNPPAPNRPGL
ncbi:MAG: hypothetical protein AAF213_10950 [Pseudomonadota bacterium]